MKENPNYYAIIPANIRYSDKLTDKEKLLYGEVTALANRKGYCWASNSYFAELYRVTTRTISRSLNQLAKLGFIEIQIIYYPDSKQIKERRIYINSCINGVSTPMDENVPTSMDENVPTPMDENVQDNNTSTNTINISSSSSSKKGRKKENKKSLTAFDDDEKRAKNKDIAKTKDIAKIEKVSSTTKTLNQENIKIIKDTIKDNFNINLEENQVQLLIKESNNDIERLKELILLATTQNISNLFGWLISALKRPKEQYKPISTTATKNTSKSYGKNKFYNYKGRKWDYALLEQLEQQYLENSVKDIELNI